MGNYVSCRLSIAIIEAQWHGPKVILPSGATRQLSAAPATAAELMLDHPGYFLVHSASVLHRRRLLALSADEELELGAVYAMFPMNRLGSVAGAEDLRRLLPATGKEVVSAAAPPPEPRRKVDDGHEGLVAEYRYMKSLSRSRRPAMDTITEEAFH